MKVIFLDVDGVLLLFNNRGVFNQECLEHLKRIINTTGAKLILSSNWKRSEASIERLNKVLKSVSLSPIHDSTPEVEYDTSIAFSRTKEIQSWLKTHQEQTEEQEDEEKTLREMKWIALDDMHLRSCASSLPFFQGLCHRFLLTNREIGITKSIAEEAIRLLS